ncbi:MAG: PIN domain-containing protein, partial [Myxococcota bacterium]
MLVDTDVLIWYMRGNPKAARALESLPDRALSAVTYMELVEGLRNKAELSTRFSPVGDRYRLPAI